MIYPDERVARTCQLSRAEGRDLLGLARKGDLEALADFVVFAAYQSLIKAGDSHAEALLNLQLLIRKIELKPEVYVPG